MIDDADNLWEANKEHLKAALIGFNKEVFSGEGEIGIWGRLTTENVAIAYRHLRVGFAVSRGEENFLCFVRYDDPTFQLRSKLEGPHRPGFKADDLSRTAASGFDLHEEAATVLSVVVDRYIKEYGSKDFK